MLFRSEPRVEKVRRALDEGDLDTAAKVLSALEAESLIHSGIADLRRQLDDALNSRKVRQHLESARKLFQEGELELALQESEELRRLDPHHAEAVDLQATIRVPWAAKERDRWLTLARLHIENHAWDPARKAARLLLPSVLL